MSDKTFRIIVVICLIILTIAVLFGVKIDL